MDTFETHEQKSNADDEQPSNNTDSAADSSHDGSRQARMARDRSGNAIGTAIWLNADELADLSVDVDAADAVAYRVVDGDLHVDTVGGSDE